MDLALQCELAELLTTLRPEGRQHSGLDVRLVPPDKHTAQSIAQMAAEELGWPIAGWKIAAIKPDMQKALRTASPIYGRVFAPDGQGLAIERGAREALQPNPRGRVRGAPGQRPAAPCRTLHDRGGDGHASSRPLLERPGASLSAVSA
jgi:hypothetical protein